VAVFVWVVVVVAELDTRVVIEIVTISLGLRCRSQPHDLADVFGMTLPLVEVAEPVSSSTVGKVSLTTTFEAGPFPVFLALS
jgi:hypothetical protein